MEKSVNIPIELYKRLGTHAQGFETPASVIERILDFYEKEKDIKSTRNVEPVEELPNNLEIKYYPPGEENFKRKLLLTKKAFLALHKIDGTIDIKEWNARNFNASSSVNGNLRSGYLRKWKKKGIIKVEISTNKNDVM